MSSEMPTERVPLPAVLPPVVKNWEELIPADWVKMPAPVLPTAILGTLSSPPERTTVPPPVVAFPTSKKLEMVLVPPDCRKTPLPDMPISSLVAESDPPERV